jgi:SsrA-binding protein
METAPKDEPFGANASLDRPDPAGSERHDAAAASFWLRTCVPGDPAPRLVRVAESTRVKPIAENRRARHDYHLLDRYEAGLQLTGTEVKSLRDGRVTLAQAYADLRDGEVWLIGAHIDEYAQGNVANHEPERDRKLLLHRREIESLIGQVQQKGLTLVPTRMYFKNGRVKLELAVGRGKEQRDKRRDIAKRDAQRDIERALRRRR